MTVYILYLSDILRLLVSFISDLALKRSVVLAINSSSMNYCFLSRWGLARQTMAGRKKLWLLLSGSCISSLNWVFVCVCVPFETGGFIPTSSYWTETRGIKGALNKNVRGATWAIVLLACGAPDNTAHDPIKMFFGTFMKKLQTVSPVRFLRSAGFPSGSQKVTKLRFFYIPFLF